MIDKKTAYIFYGRSGSGKGTQSENLISLLEQSGKTIIKIETGLLLREIATGESFTAKRTREIIDAGGLMPEFMAVHAWATKMSESITGSENLLLDGLARRIPEAGMLLSALSFYQFERIVVVYLNVSEEFATKLLSGRGRADDTPEGIMRRMKWFTNDVLPVLSFFKESAAVEFVEINGEQTIEEVWDEMKAKLLIP